MLLILNGFFKSRENELRAADANKKEKKRKEEEKTEKKDEWKKLSLGDIDDLNKDKLNNGIHRIILFEDEREEVMGEKVTVPLLNLTSNDCSQNAGNINSIKQTDNDHLNNIHPIDHKI